jgi:pregnancy-associated plasma protein-A/type IX secretion system substrate protein
VKQLPQKEVSMRRILLLQVLLFAQIILFAQTVCRTSEYRQQVLRNHPAIASRIAAIETFTQDFQRGNGHVLQGENPSSPQSSFITIPVVVHVLYNSAQQNISDAQILSQINILNQDYRRLNADTINTPYAFQPVAADCGFQFALAKVDTAGYATTGIVRKHTTVQEFGIDDAIKFSSLGGDDAWDKDSYLNIWVGSLNGGILGYSSVVGGPVENDGIVVLYTAFGTGGTATAPYNKGRTTTHETGHWLNLIHTWGDADCGDDHVDDTPPQQAADYGCPSGTIITCNNAPNGNMYPNYMDFTNDACMNLFTYGQRSRMLALFQPGGERFALLSSNALTATALPSPARTPVEAAENSLYVYPNPSSGIVTIQLGDHINIGSSLELYNQVGQKVVATIVNQLQFQLNISSLSKGIYYIQVNDGKNKVMTKLLKL